VAPWPASPELAGACEDDHPERHSPN
jgi:hypothetical protein